MRAFISALTVSLGMAAASVSPAAAHEVEKDGILIVHPMARPAIGGRPSAAYMAIVNDREQPLRLVGAHSPAFDAVELHESTDEDGVSKMRPVEVLEIAPGDTALLEAGGLHLMLMGPAEALEDGGMFPLTLIFEGGEELEIPVMVDKMAADGMEGMDHSAGQ